MSFTAAARSHASTKKHRDGIIRVVAHCDRARKWKDGQAIERLCVSVEGEMECCVCMERLVAYVMNPCGPGVPQEDSLSDARPSWMVRIIEDEWNSETPLATREDTKSAAPMPKRTYAPAVIGTAQDVRRWGR